MLHSPWSMPSLFYNYFLFGIGCYIATPPPALGAPYGRTGPGRPPLAGAPASWAPQALVPGLAG